MPINHLTPAQKEAWGRDIERRMLAKGWHQAKLARRCGVPRNNISTWINGRSYPQPLSLAKLAAALGVAVEEISLFRDTGDDVEARDLLLRVRLLEEKVAYLLSHGQGIFG